MYSRQRRQGRDAALRLGLFAVCGGIIARRHDGRPIRGICDTLCDDFGDVVRTLDVVVAIQASDCARTAELFRSFKTSGLQGEWAKVAISEGGEQFQDVRALNALAKEEMSKIDATQVSSNWKKLQAQLKASKPSHESNGLKRKRKDQSEPQAKTLYKKPRIDARARRTMGTAGSKPAMNDDEKAKPKSDLTKDHDIRAEDVSAAYGDGAAKSSVTSHAKDEINGGLHPAHKIGKYIALDCEMVGTGPPPHTDHVLARVSLVNFHGEQIYDSYVLPPKGIKVEDYRTHVSGIKPHHLRPGYARSFQEVQADVAKILHGRVLVGHALQNDLRVLILGHPKRDLRDTARYAKYRELSGGRAPALRNLARTELGLQIQSGEHSSVEDARVAMLLFQREKRVFEAENRRVFGNKPRPDGKGRYEVLQDAAGVDDDDATGEEEEDSGSEDGQQDGKVAKPKGRKKRKKKKRTKRS